MNKQLTQTMAVVIPAQAGNLMPIAGLAHERDTPVLNKTNYPSIALRFPIKLGMTCGAERERGMNKQLTRTMTVVIPAQAYRVDTSFYLFCA